MEEHIPADIPFSLVCEQCDGGMEIKSHDEAVAEGWLFIRHVPDLPSANYLGLCPECLREEERTLGGKEEA